MNKHVTSYVKDFCEEAVKFPFYEINTSKLKPKRSDAVFNAASKIFSLHFDVAAHIRLFEVTYVLAMNDCIVKPFTKECGEFIGAYNFLEKQTQNTGKQFQELGGYYKNLMSMIKRKEVLNKLFMDLDEMSGTFDFEYDKKEVATIFKESAEAKEKELQDRGKKKQAA